MTRKWGKAGERLDGSARDTRLREIRSAANRVRSARAADDETVYQRWRGGLVVPHRITAALDMRAMYGPEVDVACRAAEPEVDQWEAGERYPRWDQLVALAALTAFWPQWFTIDVEPLDVRSTSLWWHMIAAERKRCERQHPPIMRYPQSVLAARPASPLVMPAGDPLCEPLPEREPIAGPGGQAALFDVGASK